MSHTDFGPAWGAKLPADRQAYTQIICPNPGEKLRVVALSHSIETCWIHFVGGRTQPCLGSADLCFACNAGVGRRWKGFFAALLAGTDRVVIAEVTRSAALPWAERLLGRDPGLRGWGVTLWRQGKGRNGRVVLEFSTRRAEGDSLPPDIDVRRALTTIWGCEGRALAISADNPNDAPDTVPW